MNGESLLILGRQPALGLAELESLYGADAVTLIRPNVAKLDRPWQEVSLFQLGGSTRSARILTELPVASWPLVEKFFISAVLDRLNYFGEGKIKIGVSAYGFNISTARLAASTLALKKAIRNSGHSVRIVPNQSLELNTAQLEYNGLTRALSNTKNGEPAQSSGHEFLLIATGQGTTLLAQTISAQDIRFYTIRDRGRPKRDARVGMLPPKLAQIILNLALPKLRKKDIADNLVVLDPFCGTGVMLQESLLVGHATYGTDLDKRLIDYSAANLTWFEASYGPPGKQYKLETGDATTHTWQQPIDCIASETYLGQPFSSVPVPEKLEAVRSTCNVIIEKFLRNIGRQIKPGTRLCLAVPAWQIASGSFRHLPLIDQLGDLGYNRVRFEHVRNEQLLYYRENQIVARELLVLTRK